MNTTCVYTAIAGNYDERLQPHPDILGVDFIAFVDDDRLKGREDYQVVLLEKVPNPRLAAKYPKIIGHEALKDYSATIWIDANMEIVSPNFVEEALRDLGPDGFTLHSHSYRDCLYEEAEFAATMPKYAGQPLFEQCEHYRRRGFPRHGGLWSCASMARAKSKALDDLMWDWMAEIERWSLEDQVSFPFVLREHKMTPQPWPHYPPGSLQGESPWLKIHRHVDGT